MSFKVWGSCGPQVITGYISIRHSDRVKILHCKKNKTVSFTGKTCQLGRQFNPAFFLTGKKIADFFSVFSQKKTVLKLFSFFL